MYIHVFNAGLFDVCNSDISAGGLECSVAEDSREALGRVRSVKWRP